MQRLEALKTFAKYRTNELVIGNVSPIARELHAATPSELNLYFVQLGYPTPLGYGLAKALPSRRVVVFDGDGSMLCGLGVLTTIANDPPPNLTVVIFDNGCYMGGGGLPSASATGKLDFVGLAKASGIKYAVAAHDLPTWDKEIKAALGANELRVIWSKVPVPDPMDDAALPVAGYIPWDLTENTYLFRRALEKEGLVEPWHEAINPAFRLPIEELSPKA